MERVVVIGWLLWKRDMMRAEDGKHLSSSNVAGKE